MSESTPAKDCLTCVTLLANLQQTAMRSVSPHYGPVPAVHQRRPAEFPTHPRRSRQAADEACTSPLHALAGSGPPQTTRE